MTIMHIISFDGSMVAWAVLAAVFGASLMLVVAGIRWSAFPCATLGGLAASAAVLWACAPALAQTAEELQAFARDVLGRAKPLEQSVGEWAQEVQGREEAYRAEAEGLSADNAAQLKRGFTYLDDSMWKFAGEPDAQAAADPGVVYVAVSLSMPPAALRQLSADAKRAGAVLVLRGLVDNSFEKTLAAAKGVFDEHSVSGVAIDPQVFRAFDVQRVPTFIAADGPVEPCQTGVDCDSPPTPHDRVAGNISMGEALRLLSSKGAEAPDVAQAALRRMGG